MLRGKYWITPDGVFDVSRSEHALFAKNHLLKLEGREAYGLEHTFRTLTPEEQARHAQRGIDQAILDFLATPGNDSRYYVIKHLDWIRTRHGAIYLWELNDASLKLIRDAQEFWTAQQHLSNKDVVDIHELIQRPPKYLTVSVDVLRDPKLACNQVQARGYSPKKPEG